MTALVYGLLITMVMTLTVGFGLGYGLDENEIPEPEAIVEDSINDDIDPIGIIENPDPIPSRNERSQ